MSLNHIDLVKKTILNLQFKPNAYNHVVYNNYLDLIEILASIEWYHTVGRYTDYWLISRILCCVESQSSFTGI